MSHNHSHSTKNIRTAFFLNLGFTVFEIIGGFYVNSVAIMSDAIHDLGDSFSLGVSWYLQEKSKKKASKSFSFGYRRFSLLGALINSVVLITGSIFVIFEAVDRIIEPQYSDAKGMLFFAIIGIAVNGYAAWKMSTGKTLNERIISWHLIEDVLGWVAVLIVSIVLLFKDIQYLDPALSLLITVYILWNVIERLKETLFVFLQGNPKDVNVEMIEQAFLNVENVKSVHHTHLWSLDGENHVFSSHVKLESLDNINDLITVKKKLKNVLKEYNLEHYTIETEVEDEQCDLEDDSH